MPQKAILRLEDSSEIECHFNPAEFTITKTVSWNPPAAKGKNSTELKFQRGNPGTMSLTLTFDTTATGKAVTDDTNKLLSLVTVKEKPTGKTDNSNRPPWCQFIWGSFHSFKAVVDNLQLKFTYFSSTGTPLRAVATLALKQYDDKDKWPQNPTSGTPHPHAVRQLLLNQSLDRIAAEVYGDASQWRRIAEANAILDPLQLPVGSSIVIPDLGVSSRG
jgi:hypothetical protein